MLSEILGGRKLRIALVADALTRSCLKCEGDIFDLTPYNYKKVLLESKPDLVLFESVWHGFESAWRFKVASYPWYRFCSNKLVGEVTQFSRDLGVPTVFWCKEDSVHFSRFINTAKYFDYVLTVDSNCVDWYKSVLNSSVPVGVLSFPVQPKYHFFDGFNFKKNGASFLGSYSKHVHTARRAWQNMAFSSVLDSGLELDIFDRNSDFKSGKYRYPNLRNAKIYPAVSHEKTACIYKDYIVSLNVNTIADSPSMYSRRLVEILACGGIAVTSPAKSVDLLFKDYCYVINDDSHALDLFKRIFNFGLNSEDLERARAGAEFVSKNHTWEKALLDIVRFLGMDQK